MSGGSFGYLCYAIDGAGLDGRQEDLRSMASALRQYPGGEQAALDTEHVLSLLEETRRAADRLMETWRSVEWHRSGDSGPEDVAAALAGYANAQPPRRP